MPRVSGELSKVASAISMAVKPSPRGAVWRGDASVLVSYLTGSRKQHRPPYGLGNQVMVMWSDGGEPPRLSAVNELTARRSRHPAHGALRAATTSLGFAISIQVISLAISSSSACSRSQFTYSSVAFSVSLFASVASFSRRTTSCSK
jgi:hypothetical protein